MGPTPYWALKSTKKWVETTKKRQNESDGEDSRPDHDCSLGKEGNKLRSVRFVKNSKKAVFINFPSRYIKKQTIRT